MCGIAGLYGRPMPQPPTRALIRRMVEAVAHRGPDDRDVLLRDDVALGHARLSIIDLAHGRQPMLDETGEVAIVFNGEIFNYLELRRELIARGIRFRTDSDTEVILRLYQVRGTACVDALNGDFAFAIADRRQGMLMLARDRMGVRPLYHARAGDGRFCFASEVKALLEVPGITAAPDPVALDQIFTLWLPLPPRTAFRDVQELPPGHLLIVTADRAELRRYWRLEFPRRGEQAPDAREDAVAEELRELLTDAIRIRLRADVPVGAYLSGGLDSSIVALLARDLAPARLRTFSVTFEMPEFDESMHQREMVAALGTEYQSVRCTNADIGAMFPDVIRHIERPILRTAPAPLYRLSGLVRRAGFKVVLTGEGADEILAGYDIFKEAKLRAFCARQPDSQRRPLLFRRLYPYLPGLQAQSPAYLRAFFGAGLDRVGDPLFSHLPRFGTTARAKLLFSDGLRADTAGYDALAELRESLPGEFAYWDPLHQAQYLEAAFLLPGYILSAQGDRVAMAHAVETRFPYLDHRLVEFASRIPPRMKLRGLREKHILRRSMEGRLPAAISRRPKQPYRAPDGQPFFGPQAPDYVQEVLSRHAVAEAGYFDPPAVERLARKSAAQGSLGFRDSQALVGVLSTQLWHRTFIGRNAQSPPAIPAAAFA
ncbi:MAG: asparagine synthase (glutamine-hydrolyzing) [Acetobacteraceae bacterium]|nr:asparagine synthase (glutamine-hydrolyzing) [Acetobacteraceae bacterium]